MCTGWFKKREVENSDLEYSPFLCFLLILHNSLKSRQINRVGLNIPEVLGPADLSYLVYSPSAVTICLYGNIASNGPLSVHRMRDKWMWNIPGTINDREKPEYCERIYAYFFHHSSYTNWHGFETGPPQWDAGNNPAALGQDHVKFCCIMSCYIRIGGPGVA